MKKDPALREPRWPAITIWTVIGALLGVACWVVVDGSWPVIAVAAALGLCYGLFATRTRQLPTDD